LLAQSQWFSPGTPASSTTKTGRHDIAEILLKVALNTNIQIQILSFGHDNVCPSSIYVKEFEDIKWVIKIHKPKKARKHNGQKKKDKGKNNDPQNIHIKLKIE
jgi:hypothetical protein